MKTEGKARQKTSLSSQLANSFHGACSISIPQKSMMVLKVHGIPLAAKTENKRTLLQLGEGIKKWLLLAIDDGLNQVLGENGTKNIYCFLEQKCNMKPEDLPNNLEKFQVTLKEVFGAGALIIEKAIMENLYSHFNSNNEQTCLKYKSEEQFNLINYVMA